MSEQFLTWEMLGSYSGTLGMVLILTQLTKALPGIVKIPTQLYSYLVALAVMLPTAIFSGRTGIPDLVLLLFNAAVAALSANGGYDALVRAMQGKTE
ncbi:MAG: hypothetical protein E7604_06370 [Ruminococcaceae bacterium]|nr:hypothetical protein [Oscillospiraceae bacterium]